ncbi:ATP-binding protein [Streptomyces sp. NPDC048417]|uniref:ATP-binding protein n=1 Tax=Streptomyces sp. NPDC048417 TaxID=3155387 RepID=UPI00341D86BA
MPSAVSPCPIVTDDVSEVAVPSPDTLAYSFTLPAGVASCRVARAATRVVLKVHGLEDMTDAAVQVVSELAACAWRFTPGEDVYVSLRYREDALRVVLYDGHPRHRHPRVAAACEVRRRAALRVLGCVVRACEGEWGFGEVREPGGGTRMWVVLPGWGARGW